jgi:hypothetical protein
MTLKFPKLFFIGTGSRLSKPPSPHPLPAYGQRDEDGKSKKFIAVTG